MKTMSFFKNSQKAMTAFVFAASMSLTFTACSDESEDLVEMEETVENKLNGLGATADTYNYNDARGDFSPLNWRSQSAIYLYDGQGSERDSENHKGYIKVSLPWNTGDVLTNLPNGFCNDITPENGWELVLNRCGSRSIENNNFFVLYNKFTGILRFFYYQPKNFQSGNDHVWETTMTDNMAQSTTLRYGVPRGMTISDKQAIGQNSADGTITEYITPWVGTSSEDGLITPNTGWWAFDVDLSLYNGKGLDDDDNIRLQMRSWETAHVSLNSLLTAQIDGTVTADLKLLQSQHLGNSTMGMLTKLGSGAGSAYSLVKNLTAHQWSDAFGSVMSLGKTVCNMCGIKTGQAQDIEGSFDGTIALGLNGEIATNGIISTSKPTQGIVSPTFFMKDFNRINAPAMGEGIWNLEQSPVVYYTNAYVDWKYEYKGIETCSWLDRTSPFKGQLNQGTATDSPYRGRVCYFDPSSIKVILNDNVFTPEEIASAKVYAVCGVRSSAMYGSTEGYRKAMKMQPSQFTGNTSFEYANRPFTDAPFDALSSYDDKMGKAANTQFATETYNGHKYGVFGRGDASYLLEPQALAGKDAPEMMPAYEVTVTVVVEHNGKPIVFTRTYLPDYKEMRIENMPEITDSYIQSNKPANYVAELYSRQMAHIKDIRKWTRRTLIPTGGTPCHMPVMYTQDTGSHVYTTDKNPGKVSLKESYPALFDDDLSDRWVAAYDNVTFTYKGAYSSKTEVSSRSVGDGVWYNSPCWFVEFKSSFPISPRSYTLISANDAGKYPQCNPKVWCLYGKKRPNDPWTKLGASSFNNQPEDMLPNANSKPTRELPFRLNNYQCKDMQYFRFEVMYQPGTSDPLLRLGEIRFNYDD